MARTGWASQHVLVETCEGELLGAAPCYLKSHSRGEYVFDHGWADAYERAGGSYYPKLQVSVPFTPATGPRLLVRPGLQAHRAKEALAAGLLALCERRRASSVHVTFLPEADWDFLGEKGFLKRTDQQFHWRNDGYASFDDFLAALASRKRKAIRRERSEALDSGITIHPLTGRDLTEAIWDDFFGFYMDTGSRKWGRPYLTRAFFSMIGETMADRILLVMAKRNGRHIAGAINFIGTRHSLWPPLGRGRTSSLPAFRALLLPGDRVCDRQQAQGGRGRRAGRTQARARLCAGHHLFVALHCRSGAAPGDRRLSEERTRLCGCGRPRA